MEKMYDQLIHEDYSRREPGKTCITEAVLKHILVNV